MMVMTEDTDDEMMIGLFTLPACRCAPCGCDVSSCDAFFFIVNDCSSRAAMEKRSERLSCRA
jgi:hypothetical protein